jgi:hypothetical protein
MNGKMAVGILSLLLFLFQILIYNFSIPEFNLIVEYLAEIIEDFRVIYD